MIEHIAHRPINQQLFKLSKGKQRIHFTAIDHTRPAFALAQQRKNQLAKNSLVNLIATQGNTMGRFDRKLRALAAQNTKIQGAATKIHGQHQLIAAVGIVIQVADSRRCRFRAKALLGNTRMAIGFTETLQCHIVATLLHTLEIHWMANTGLAAVINTATQGFANTH